MFAAIVFEACTGNSSAPSNPGASASVTQIPGCISHSLNKVAGSESDFTYEFTTGSLSLNFLLPGDCTPDSVRFATSHKISNDTIFVISVDTATMNERCLCTYLVHAEFDGLPLDRYYIVCTRIDGGVETVPYSQYVYRQDAYGTSQEVVYSNSFESPADTVGWIGYGTMQFRNDVPPGGGQHSLFVSGGCTVPHAAFKIGRVARDSRFVVKFWGKNLGNGGSVGLGFGPGPFGGIAVSVDDTVWTQYESQDILYCPADSTLWLTLNAGGIVASSMLVDNIQVLQLK